MSKVENRLSYVQVELSIYLQNGLQILHCSYNIEKRAGRNGGRVDRSSICECPLAANVVGII